MNKSNDSRLGWLAVPLLVLVCLLAACAAAPPAQDTPTAPGESYPVPPTPVPIPPTVPYPVLTETAASAPTAAVSGPVEALAAEAIDDLAQRTGVDSASIQVIEASPQSWPDASLGCPQDGQLYAQVISDGYRIVLEAGGQRYAYHTDRDKAVFCEQDQP